MAGYVPIDGVPTWVDDRGGAGEPLLLLHGGLSDSDQLLDTIGRQLESRHRVLAFDRRGHGFTRDTADDFHYAEMVTQAIAVLDTVVGGRAHVMGWSDGGIVALLVALARPDLVHRLVVVGANYHYDAMLPADPEESFRRAVRASYNQRSPDGAEHFTVVVRKSLALWRSEPTLTLAEIARITAPTLVVAGDDDQVSLAHTCALYEALPHGRLAILPGASHALPVEQPQALAGLVGDFLTSADPPRTLLPVRRARGAVTQGS